MVDDKNSTNSEQTASDLFQDPLAGLEDSPQAIDLNLDSENLPQNFELPQAESPTNTGILSQTEADVNQMLSVEVEKAESTANTDTLAAAKVLPLDKSTRLYYISLRGLNTEALQKEALEILARFPLETVDANFTEKIRTHGGYKFSHLSEYHAYALMFHFYKAGMDAYLGMLSEEIEVSPKKFDLESNLTEEHKEIVSTGAHAVPLPNGPSEILLATIDQIPGYTNTQNKGIVSAHGSIARAFFREEEKEARLRNKLFDLQQDKKASKRPHINLPMAEIDKVFHHLLLNLQKEAFRRGANGVLGVQISGFPESNSLDPEADQIRLIATGTAALLETIKS